MTPRCTSWFALLAGLAVAGPLHAISESEAQSTAEQTAVDVEKRLPEVLNAKPASRPTPEQRLAAGEVLLRQRNYERAAEVFVDFDNGDERAVSEAAKRGFGCTRGSS